jgi:hypothetical protein
VVLFYQKAGFEGSLVSAASVKRTNSRRTVAVGPVEVIPLSSDGKVVVVEVPEVTAVAFHRTHAHSRYWTFQNQLAAALASARFVSSSTPTSDSAPVSQFTS